MDEPSRQSEEMFRLLAEGVTGDRQRAWQAGFDRHLVKPVEPVYPQEILAAAPALRQVPRAR